MSGNENGPAESTAEVVVAQRGTRSQVAVVEEAVGIEDVVPEKFVQIPVEHACPRPGDDVDLPARASSVFRIVLATNHPELIDRVHARIGQERQVRAAVDIVRAVHRPVVLRGPVSVDGEIDLIRKAGWARNTDIELVRGEAGGNAWREGYELLVVSRVKGKLADLRPGDQPGGCRRLQLDGRHIRLDSHGFFDVSRLKSGINGQLVVHVERDSGPGVRLESLGFHSHGIVTDRKKRHDVITVLVRRYGPHIHILVRVGCGYQGARDNRARRIRYRADDGSRDLLGHRHRGAGTRHHQSRDENAFHRLTPAGICKFPRGKPPLN